MKAVDYTILMVDRGGERESDVIMAPSIADAEKQIRKIYAGETIRFLSLQIEEEEHV